MVDIAPKASPGRSGQSGYLQKMVQIREVLNSNNDVNDLVQAKRVGMKILQEVEQVILKV